MFYELESVSAIGYIMTRFGQVKRGGRMITDQPIPTMVRSIAEAKAHFSAIVDEASGGKAFIICRAGRPLVMITPYVQSDPVRRPGALKGKIHIMDDFDTLPDGFEEAFG